MSRRVIAQGSLFPADSSSDSVNQTDSTFLDNLSLPVHRWFRFSAGYSGAWVESVIRGWKSPTGPHIFDPFAGSGTTLLAAEAAGVPSYGVEAHPFVVRVARAKLCYRSDPDAFLQRATRIVEHARRLEAALDHYPKLIRTCYSDESLAALDRLRRSWQHVDDGTPAAQLSWLALVGILRQVSHVGTAPWQYVLPRKTKRNALDPMAAFQIMARTMATDMRMAAPDTGPIATLVQSDARTCDGVPDAFADLVITSPPYANNYDYADATRLEMTFMGEIDGWGDLQRVVRNHLMRSCSQHVPEGTVRLEDALATEELAALQPDIGEVCQRLAAVRHSHGGKKTYHLMVACYFLDMARVWRALRHVCARPSTVCFVVGDSAPYGVYVPVIDWIGRLAGAAGFNSWQFEKTRDRNVKWKNRKHRVPLCEGRLWVRG